MKAPRKTVKRPIFRHMDVAKDKKIEFKNDAKEETKNEVVDKNTEVLIESDSQKIEFGANMSSVFTIDPIDDFDDIDLNLGETYADIDDIENTMLDLFTPIDFEGII